jgi:hypothetical protein
VFGGGEHQHAVAVRGGTRVELDNVTIKAVYGDGLYVATGANGVWMHDVTVESCGRMGIAVVSGSNVLSEDNEFTTVGYGLFDVEPNSGGICNDVTFRNNHAQRISLAGPNGFFFGANATVSTGTQANRITVHNNVIEEDALYCYVTMADVRRTDITITDNTSNGSAKPGPVMNFAHVDGLTVTGNTQALSSGSLITASDCTATVLSPNP